MSVELKGIFREVSTQLAELLAPDSELFAALMANMADTQEQIAKKVLEDG